MLKRMNHDYFASQWWYTAPYLERRENGQVLLFSVQKSCRLFCVQISDEVIEGRHRFKIPDLSFTLNWKLKTGGSFLMLSLLLASYNTIKFEFEEKKRPTYMSCFTAPAAVVIFLTQLLWLSKSV